MKTNSPAGIYEQTHVISSHQRRWGLEARMSVTSGFSDTREYRGKMLREDIVDGVRYLAVRWTGHGVATYRADDFRSYSDVLVFQCKLIHWGI